MNGESYNISNDDHHDFSVGGMEWLSQILHVFGDGDGSLHISTYYTLNI